MEKKKSKGFFSVLFAPKSGSGCCNVQFEEISDEVKSKEEKNRRIVLQNDRESKSKENKK